MREEGGRRNKVLNGEGPWASSGSFHAAKVPGTLRRSRPIRRVPSPTPKLPLQIVADGVCAVCTVSRAGQFTGTPDARRVQPKVKFKSRLLKRKKHWLKSNLF